MRIPLPCAATALLLASVTAQSGLEPGYGVYARLFNTVAPTVPGGLVVFHPYLGMNAEVTGLPDALTGAGYTATGGANAVLVRDADGALFASSIFRDDPSVIYEIMLDGTAATVTNTYPIGGAVPLSTIDQLAWLPGDRILFSHRGVDVPGWNATGLGILDLGTGAVSEVMINDFPAGRQLNSVAVDATGTTAWFGTFAGGGGIFSVPVAGGSAVAVPGWGTSPSAVQQLSVDYDGTLIVGFGSAIGALTRIDPVTGDTTHLVDMGGTLNGLFIEPVTGDYVFQRINAAAGISTLFWWNDAQGALPVEVPGMSGIESPSGLGIRASLLPFGVAATGSVKEWQIRPNPGGAPRAGNTAFGLTVTSPTTAAGVIAFATDPAAAPVNTPLVGNLLLDPGSLLPVSRLVPPSTSFTVQLPLTRSLRAADLYAQMLTIAPNGPPLLGGEGLWIHVYD